MIEGDQTKIFLSAFFTIFRQFNFFADRSFFLQIARKDLKGNYFSPDCNI